MKFAALNRRFHWRKKLSRKNFSWPLLTGNRALACNPEELPNELEGNVPDFRLEDSLGRQTPIGLNEQDLLIALNRGNLRALQRFPGIGPKISENIQAYRGENKIISSLDELIQVPLIGQYRFKSLVGRDSTFHTHRLHALLRINLEKSITRSVFPVLWPAPGLARISLVSHDALRAEKDLAERNNHVAIVRNVGEERLVFHRTSNAPQAWASVLIKELPRALRKIQK
ncbi:MAG: helix-hairpin-helix domain-containing protein [Verrucomicrobiota bacterium]